MHEIVETIQAKQNEIIRYAPDKNIIVQGVAGSGKTQVALHRIAYLMYKSENQLGLSNEEVLLVSPNEEFSDYVSNVLPELEGVRIPMETLENLCKEYLFKQDVEDFGSFIERFYITEKKDPQIAYKFNDVDLARFIETVEVYSKENPSPRLSDIPYINELKTERERIEQRLEEIKDDFKDSINDLGENRVHRWLQDGFAPKNPPPVESGYSETRRRQERERDVYKELVELLGRADLTGRVLNEIVSLGRYYNLIDRIKAASFGIIMQPGDIKYFYHSLFEKTIGSISEGDKICYEDEQFFLAMRFVLQGKTAIHSDDGYWFIKQDNLKIVDNKIRHVVIDEAQDYTPMQIWLISQMFSRAVFTILGDRNQNVNPYFIHNTLDGIINNAEYFEINDAYRSSPEIIEYTNKILTLSNVESKRESQNHPVEERIVSVIKTEMLKRDIETLRESKFNRIAIITKNREVANKINEKVERFDENVHIIPVYRAKGLEYDAVIVISNYSEDEKELLYTACTRAQHKLIVYKKVT
jgi:DNA helicase-2/ATP-dependent DNA helicase PcrA